MWNIEKLVKKGKYLYAIVRNHPNRTKNNYVLHHRIVVENHIKRLLEKDEIVHHKDENGHNNEISNLEIIKNQSEHQKLHVKRGITTVTLICPNCNNEFTKPKNKTHLIKGGNPSCCSNRCRGQYYYNLQINKPSNYRF